MLGPAEIRHVRLSKAPFGYRRSAVDALLEEVTSSFEEVWRERADLRERVEELESDIVRYRELETLLRSTLVSAERSAQELRESARREADVIIDEAHAEARSITWGAAAERERLLGEVERVRGALRAALATLPDGDAELPGNGVGAVPASRLGG